MPQIKYSPETTYFNGPLDESGYVDYAAALNLQHKKFLPGQNVVIPLLGILATESWPLKSDLTTFTRLIGEDLPTHMTTNFISYNKYISLIATERMFLSDKNSYQEFTKSTDLLDHNLDLDQLEELSKVISSLSIEMKPDDNSELDVYSMLRSIKKHCRTRPWDKKRFPFIASWISANTKAIDTMKRMSNCKGYYWPIIPDKYSFINSKLLEGGRIFDLVNCMQTATMGMIYDGNINGAINNVLVIFKFGYLFLGSNDIGIDLRGAWIVKQSLTSILTILKSEKFSIEHGEKLLETFDSFSPLPDGSRALKVSTIVEPLYSVTEMMRKAEKKCAEMKKVLMFDYNVATKEVTRSGHMLCKFLDEETIYKRLKKIREIAKKIKIEYDAAQNASSFDIAIDYMKIGYFTHRWAKRAAMTKQITKILARPPHSDKQIYETMVAFNESFSLIRIAIRLRIFKIKNGEYPVTLSELKSSYPNISLIDSLIDKPLTYRLEGNGFIIYSFGLNQVDDGGKGGFLYDINKDDFVIRLGV